MVPSRDRKVNVRRKAFDLLALQTTKVKMTIIPQTYRPLLYVV